MIDAFLELRAIHRLFGAAELRLEQHIGKSLCLPGCGLCCQVNLPMWTTIEAIHAVSVLTGRTTITKMVAIAEGWLTEPDPRATLYEGTPEGWASPQLVAEWQAMRSTQCPFLSDTKVCLIHEVRPLACRAWGVTLTDNGALCPRPPGRGETLTQRAFINGTPIRQQVEGFKDRCREKKRAWLASGFVPTVLYRAAKPDEFKCLVLNNRVASAKLVGTEFEVSLMWQPQVEALRSGASPDLVAAVR